MNCNQCNSNDIIEGHLENNNEIIFNLSQVQKKASENPVAFACTKCGHIQLSYNFSSIKVCFCRDLVE